MSYYILKNLKLDEKNNKMSAEVADSCWRDDSGKFIFDKTEDIYPSIKTWEEKYAHLIWSIITGGVRIEGNNKMKRLEGLDGQGGINEILNEKKEYVLKHKENNMYIKSIGQKFYKCTYDLEDAKKYTRMEAKNIIIGTQLEMFNYKDELYRLKDTRFNIYVEAIVRNQGELEKSDLIQFMECYELENDGQGKYSSYLQLQEKYPDDKLISEIARIISLVKNEEIVLDYESKKELMKDNSLSKDINYNITEETEEQYKKSKQYVDSMKEKISYDYDYNKQFEILDKAFKDRYISKELYQEFCEETYEEDMAQ